MTRLFNDGPSGMFRVRVGDDWYSWTQLESIDARAVFPSFDDPHFKTPFTVTLRTPPGLVAVSNAPEVSKALEAGREVHRFAPTLPLPTYLVAMMVGPFAVAEGEVPPTPQRIKPLPLRIISTRQNAGKLGFALDGSKQIVALLEDYFGDAFPYPKLDQITTPILPGAMENAGADLYRDELLVLTAMRRSRSSAASAWSCRMSWRTSGSAISSLCLVGRYLAQRKLRQLDGLPHRPRLESCASTSVLARWQRASRRWEPMRWWQAGRSGRTSPPIRRSTPPSIPSHMARAAMSWR